MSEFRIRIGLVLLIFIQGYSQECGESPCCEDPYEIGTNFFVSGEYLYWQPNEGGLDYGILVKNFSTPPLQTGGPSSLNFQWSNGYRLEAGYRLPNDRWEISARWTQFSSLAKGNTIANSAELLFPQFTNSVLVDSLSTSPITEIKGRWKLHLKMIDGEFSRRYNAAYFLLLRPLIGVRGA